MKRLRGWLMGLVLWLVIAGLSGCEWIVSVRAWLGIENGSW